MQIDIPEMTIRRIVDRVRLQSSSRLSDREIVAQILDALSRSTNGLTFTELAAQVCDRPPETTPETAREVAERLGLVGAFTSGVSDLSTNPKHMTGFGQ